MVLTLVTSSVLICLRFCIANACIENTVLDPAVTEDSNLEDLSDNCLRGLVCAANSVAIGYRPVLKLTDKFFFDLLMRFARTKEVIPVPIEERSRQELLDLLEQTRSMMEKAEILVTPIVCWVHLVMAYMVMVYVLMAYIVAL